MRKKIIIISDQYGRLGNRLHLFAQMISYSTKSRCEIWMPGFFDYKDFFENIKNIPVYGVKDNFILQNIDCMEFFNSINRINKILHSSRFFRKLRSEFYSPADGNPWNYLDKSNFKINFFNGFVFHEYMLDCSKVVQDISYLFQPASQYIQDINEPIQELRSSNRSVCGVLIRQTDYRSWNDGIYFFSSPQYNEFIEHISSFFKKEEISFFIATDEKQPSKLFKNINCMIRVGYPVENLYSLSKCDFLVGPPSSYIGWSAFYGNKPLLTIEDYDNFMQKNIKKELNLISC